MTQSSSNSNIWRDRLWRTPALGLALAIVTSAFALVGPSEANAEPGKSTGFVWQGEELYYSVEVNGAEAARASLRAGKTKKVKGISYVPLSAKAISHGFFAKSYPVDDNADTFVNAETLRPIKADKVIREDGKHRVYKVRYDPASFTASVTRVMDKKKTRNFQKPVPSGIHDGLSWLYELRTKPLKNGDTYTFYVFDGWKLSRLHATVVGRDKAWTQLKTYDAVKIDIEREILTAKWNGTSKKRLEPRLETKKSKYYFATLHISDDAARVPVRVFVTSKLGDSDFKLIKYVAPAK